MKTCEFSTFEPITAVIVLTNPDTGEQCASPLIFGHYGSSGAAEVWIEQDGKRIQFDSAVIPAFMKQLKRAAQMAAQEVSEQE